MKNTPILIAESLMTAHKKLGESILFKMALSIPIAMGTMLFAATLLSNKNFSVCFTSECVNYFFQLYKIPLSILGLSVPLTAIVAALHRSEEAHQQIQETLKQNTFNNYIKHQEEFYKILEIIEKKCFCRFTDPLTLYRRIFPRNNYSNFTFVAHSKHEPFSKNNFLENMRIETFKYKETLYNPETDENALIELIINIQHMTSSLHLLPSVDSLNSYPGTRYVWPLNMPHTSIQNLKTIQRELYSFGFYKSDERGDRERLQAYLDGPNGFETAADNTIKAAQLATEIEKDI
ncbi:hypothetical protein HX891_11525 [Pseudomonas reactans]|uniref:hypothetical protein n=1 Tax=Pseudomonas reactans TaxID=117680 RepID=UPI0015B80AA5|nr:hypothetical protein [Pseudomonas reactans]NWD81003.1 hypothetical protein [Pseudomonas reactans]